MSYPDYVQFTDSWAKQIARAEMRMRNDWVSATIRDDIAKSRFTFLGDDSALSDFLKGSEWVITHLNDIETGDEIMTLNCGPRFVAFVRLPMYRIGA